MTPLHALIIKIVATTHKRPRLRPCLWCGEPKPAAAYALASPRRYSRTCLTCERKQAANRARRREAVRRWRAKHPKDGRVYVHERDAKPWHQNRSIPPTS